MKTLLQLAGLAQVVLAMGSLLIPGILGWKGELAKVRPLIREMFWVYAAYIFVVNLSFGLISLFDTDELTAHTKLAAIIEAFIALYWISRVLIQFLYFSRADFPKGRWHKAAEMLLASVFVFLSAAYSFLFYTNLH